MMKSNPYTEYGIDLAKLKTYNKYIYPLALALNKKPCNKN